MFMCDGYEEWFHLNRVGLKLPSPDSLLINDTVVQHVKHNFVVFSLIFHITYCKFPVHDGIP